MDELGRITLRAEITADVDVIKDAARTARARLGKGSACDSRQRFSARPLL